MTKSRKSVKNEVSIEPDLIVKSDLYDCVYSVYDTALKVFHTPFICKSSELGQVCDQLVNNVSSKYYLNTSQYELYKLGEFDYKRGIVFNYTDKEYLSRLDTFINDNTRKIQIAIQTLNFLPQGYFKMPDEFKRDIQEKIDKAIVDYCEEFIENNPSIVEQYQSRKAGE